MGIMLETVSDRLSQKGGPHWASPDKVPAARLETIRLAGELAIPFTSGILIGIGETREERIEALLALKALGDEHGHLGEVIVQNFRAKPGTRMAGHPDAAFDDQLWTVAAARIVLGPDWHVQAPPNLAYDDFPLLLDAGIDDWGGVSPVTVDHVNPEAPWPEIERLREATASRGLDARSAPAALPRARRRPRSLGRPGRRARRAAGLRRARPRPRGSLGAGRAGRGAVHRPARRDPARARRRGARPRTRSCGCSRPAAAERERVIAAADRLRREVCGDEVTYVVTRNIQYTNVCYFRCGFCAFSKGKLAENLRGPAFLVPMDEIVRRSVEAWERGATEVCLQGGIHPSFTGDYYAEVVSSIRAAVPGLHVHAFSALEVWQGAATLGLSLDDYLARLRDLGLGSLPGTAAEILDDEVRAIICPDKVSTDQWLEVHDAAHRVGLRSNVTMMMGHVDAARPLGEPPPPGARAAGAERRLHRVRAAAVRADGGADVPQGARPPRADVRRGAARPRRRPARAASADHEHPGLVGQARARGRPAGARRRRQRPRRDADERVDLARGRVGVGAGASARADGGA